MVPTIEQANASRCVIGVALCLFALAGQAQTTSASTAPTPAAGAAQTEPATSDLRFSGFGTLGVVHADAPEGWGFRRDIRQPAHDGGTRADIDSRVGLQLNYSPTPRFELVGQVLATRRSRYAGADESLEWAFAAYRPVPDVVLRIGRLNLDQFLMSDYRNVGFAYRFARPPVEFYGSLPTSLDGVDAARIWNVGGAQWRAKVFFGRMSSGDLGTDGDVEIKPAFGAMVSREADGLMLRAGLTRASLKNSPPVIQPLLDGLKGVSALPVPEVAAEARALHSRLDFSGDHANYAALALAYERDDWQLTTEITRVTGHPVVRFGAAYANVGRRFGPVTVFGGISHIRRSVSHVETPAWDQALTPVLGPEAAAQVQALGSAAALAANMTAAHQRTLSLGARWDLHPRMALKLQWDRVRIDATGARLWANATPDDAKADVASLVLDFVF